VAGSLVVSSFAYAAPAAAREYHFTVPTTQPWTDTGVDLQKDDVLEISAAPAGEAANTVPDRHAVGSTANTCAPQGASGASGSNLPVPDALPGALIVRLQADGAAQFVGTSKELRVAEAGHLFFGINADSPPSCTGNYAVTVHIAQGTEASGATPAPASTPASPAGNAENLSSGSQPAAATSSPASSSTPAATTPGQAKPDIKAKLAAAAQIWLGGQFGGNAAQSSAATAGTGNSAVAGGAAAAPALTISDAPLDGELRKGIDALPRRVNDKLNNLGDMVNFVLVGSEDQVKSSLEAANWHIADTDNKEAAIKAVLQTYQKKDYLQMPMSQLYLFGRVQDYGYEQAEAYAVVASRHHFRLWKAPFTWNGQTVWVGAGTHDIGFEKDQRNGSVTHKIDPAVDGERENIGASLQKAEKVKSMSYYLPPSPVQEARNATGGGYHSDGRLLVITLK
jgi:hypothetical protein